ncbi:MAG: hypothetical protein DRO05_02505 [Thermoproteota archaeon]|nr:MAG: hypothetical protein DRO05_02505 [Candidatus Korarchaeota archaeon]
MRSRRLGEVLLVLLSFLISAISSAFIFRGVPRYASWEGSPLMHMSPVNRIMKYLPALPRWNDAWFFGSPAMRFYPPFSHLAMALIGWALGISVFQAYRVFTYLSFGMGSAFLYLLSRSLGLKRRGSFASVVLFSFSYNLYSFWDVGSIPSITGVFLFIGTFYFFVRAVESGSFIDTLVCGALFAATSLSHFHSAFIMILLLLLFSALMIVMKPELLMIIKPGATLPEYTFRLPKVLLKVLIVGFGLSAWWWFPFFMEGGYSQVTRGWQIGLAPVAGVPEGQAFLKHLELLFGVTLKRNLWSPGIGQVLLALAGLPVLIKDEEAGYVKLAAAGFVISFVALLFPILGVPFPLPNRFSPYLSLFSAIIGGYVLQRISGKISVVLPIILVLTITPALRGVYVNIAPNHRLLETRIPDEMLWLRENSKRGERLATDMIEWIWRLDLYTDLGLSGGSSQLAMTNEFAYTFWYYLTNLADPSYLAYFSRQYNVRFFYNPKFTEGLRRISGQLYEVEDFNSSLVELVSSDTIKVLVFGSYADYQRIFSAISPAVSDEIVIAYGGELVELHSMENLSNFEVLYLFGIRYVDGEEYYWLLREYVEKGGSLIIDTGDLSYGGASSGLKEPFPITDCWIRNSNFNISLVGNWTSRPVNASMFSRGEYGLSYALNESLREGATPLIVDEDKAVLAAMIDYGRGKVLWTGLNLPYHAVLNMNKEESLLLEEIIRAVSERRPGSGASIRFEYPLSEELTIYVSGADESDSLFVKISYYRGWSAYLDGRKLKIFEAGPGMMLIFPKASGDFKVEVRFEKTDDVVLGEGITAISALLLVLLAVYVKIRRRV